MHQKEFKKNLKINAFNGIHQNVIAYSKLIRRKEKKKRKESKKSIKKYTKNQYRAKAKGEYKMDKIKEFKEYHLSTSSAYTGKNLQVSFLVTSILLAMHIVLPTNIEEDVVYAPSPNESIESVERVYYEEEEKEEKDNVEVINLNFSE